MGFRRLFVQKQHLFSEFGTFTSKTSYVLLPSQRNPAAVDQLQRDGDPTGLGSCGLGHPSGRCTYLWNLPQNQVCRWLWEPVFILPDQVLRSLWGEGVPEVQHGKKNILVWCLSMIYTLYKTPRCSFWCRKSAVLY